MPHLNEISKEYKDKGVVVTAINVWEESDPKDDSYVAKVEKYVKDFGEGMSFNVVTDDPSGSMAKAWMEASGAGGIPTTFVVDGHGKIIWIGHPMALDEPLKQMLAGTYDPAAAKAAKEKADRERNEMRAKFAPINKAVAAKDYKLAVAEIDKIYDSSESMRMNLGMSKFNFLMKYDEAGAYKWAATFAKDPAVKDDANALNSIAWTIIDPAAKPAPKKPDYKLAIKISERSNELSKNENPMFLDTLGLAYFKGGQVKKAIEVQTKAVQLAKASGDFPEDMVKELSDRLEMMKKKA